MIPADKYELARVLAEIDADTGLYRLSYDELAAEIIRRVPSKRVDA